MKSVIKGLKFIIKYGGIVFAIIEIFEFAIEKLEKFSSDTKEDKKQVE